MLGCQGRDAGWPSEPITVKCVAPAKLPLGRDQLKRFKDWDDGRPETELNLKFYRQATNKIVGIKDETAAFLERFFLSAVACLPKRLRPGFGGSLAAREPVWDGEGWGCDRVANSIPCCRSARAGR